MRKVLIWTFWDYKSLWSKKSTPIQSQGVIGAPPTMYFQKMQILGVFCPFLQRSLYDTSGQFVFVYFLGEIEPNIEGTKRHSEIKWPLA